MLTTVLSAPISAHYAGKMPRTQKLIPDLELNYEFTSNPFKATSA